MLERERGVVQNEKRQGENQPYGRVFSACRDDLPASHPYSWSTIGSMADLDAASLDDVKAWYQTYYGPNNCVLVARRRHHAGARAGAREEVLRRHSAGPAARARRRLDAALRPRHPRPDGRPRAAGARLSRLARAGVARRRTAAPRAGAGALSGSRSARLDRRLVYERSSRPTCQRRRRRAEIASLFVVIATVKPGVDPAAVEREIDARLVSCSRRARRPPSCSARAPGCSRTSRAASSDWAASAAAPTSWRRA